MRISGHEAMIFDLSMIPSKPSDLPAYTVSSPFRRSTGRVPLDKDYSSLFKIYFKEFSKFLGTYTTQGRDNARQKLSFLTTVQFYELSTDVYDEVLRRTTLSHLVPHLMARPEFHPKRNQARAKLSALVETSIKELTGDAHFEITRRYPYYVPRDRDFHDRRNTIAIYGNLADPHSVQGKNDANESTVPTEMILIEYENKIASLESELSKLQTDIALLQLTAGKPELIDFSESQGLPPPSSSENSSTHGPTSYESESAHLRAALEDEQQRKAIVNKTGSDAQFWLDSLQSFVDHPEISPQLRTSIFTTIIHLSKKSGLYPRCLTIQNVRKVGEHPVGGGGFGDVWEGVLESAASSPRKVCLKVLRVFRDSPVEHLLKGCLREAIVWRQLKHPNVLPFLGIYYIDDTRKRLSLVSPWMEEGNLVQFLQVAPRQSVNHDLLVSDIAAGLCYLHRMKIVHGDLKALNILITPHFRACITDFGLSRVTDTLGIQFSTSTDHALGTARWLSPELLQGGSFISKESDIYAFGCICYEIFTGLLPFHDVMNEMAVALQVLVGKRPSRVDSIDDLMWELMAECWNQEPASRPTAGDVVERLTTMNTTFVPAPDWNDAIFTQMWSNVEHNLNHS